MASGGAEAPGQVHIPSSVDSFTMSDRFGVNINKAAALALAGVAAHCQGHVPYVPTPFMLRGRIEVKEGAWLFKVNNANPSPLQATATPENARSRTQCLQYLARGLTLLHGRLDESHPMSRRDPRRSDLEGMSPAVDAQGEYLCGLDKHHMAVWDMYDQAYCHFFDELLVRKEDDARFILTCLKIHCRLYALIANRYALAARQQLLEAAGLENLAVDTQIELIVGYHQLRWKVREFCSRHPWVKIDLGQLGCSDGSPGTGVQLPFAAITTEDALGLQSRLIAQLQGNVGCTVQAYLDFQFPGAQLVLSALKTLSWVRRDHSHMHTSSARGQETATDNKTGLNSKVDCPICGLDLYVSPPYDLPTTRAKLATALGRSLQSLGSKIYSTLTRSLKTAATATTTATTTPNPNPEACMATREFWLDIDNDKSVPPKPVFCSECRSGHHEGCLLRSKNLSRLSAGASRFCAHCRTHRRRQRRERRQLLKLAR